MKKRKLAAIAAMAAIGLFSLYQCTTPPITYKIDGRLIEINDTLKTLSEDMGLRSFSVYSFHTNPRELSDIIPSEAYRNIRQLDIKVIHFYNGPDHQSAAFRADRFLFSLSPLWYYRYSEDGLIEEEIVPSIEDSVRQQDGPPYFFCQRAEVPNWFFCTSDSGG